MPRLDEITRRSVLRAGLAALAVPSAMGAAPREGEIAFRVVETAGLRRFGFPVHAVLPRPESMSGAKFRLSRGGKPVPAQFREAARPDGHSAIALDFIASPGPLESESYAVHHGRDVEPGPEPKGGMRVERVGPDFKVSAFTVPGDLRGFLKAANFGKNSYLADGSEGLILRLKDGASIRLGSVDAPMKATIVREGPLAACLRFEGATTPGSGRPVRSVVEMTFPSSKSWIETTWTIDDPEGSVASVGVDLQLKIEGPPTLIDLGANSTVYAALKGREIMELAAGSAPDHGRTWIVRKGTPDKMSAYAEAPTSGSPPAEGWAHVMDRTRCTALAVADFGRSARDKIEVDATGRVKIWREFGPSGEGLSKGTKSLTFWFHFVGMPVQVGAATSPQAMLAPLKVIWE